MLKLKSILLPLSLLSVAAFAQTDMYNQDQSSTLNKSYIFQNSMVPVGSDVTSTTLTLLSDNGCNITGGGTNQLNVNGTVLGHNIGRVHMDEFSTCSLSFQINTADNMIPLTVKVENGALQYPTMTQEDKELLTKENISITYSHDYMTFRRGDKGECVVWKLKG
ncbi:hypothetical protein VT25_16270 [Photobacterium leiognathi subsp. mandapamensis]|nr:hypothetical protein VT25_16270 [Photobacterium leiognathi subsp. mandapamensis]